MLLDKTFFRGVGSRILFVDPTGLDLPTMTVGKVYTLDPSGDLALAAADSDVVLGVYVGETDGGLLQFEQGLYTSEGDFTSKGTRWYLAAAGALTSTPGDVLFGVAVDEDKLWILPRQLPGAMPPPP